MTGHSHSRLIDGVTVLVDTQHAELLDAASEAVPVAPSDGELDKIIADHDDSWADKGSVTVPAMRRMLREALATHGAAHPAVSASDAQDVALWRWIRDKAAQEVNFDHTMNKDDGGHHLAVFIPFEGDYAPFEDEGPTLEAAVRAAITKDKTA